MITPLQAHTAIGPPQTVRYCIQARGRLLEAPRVRLVHDEARQRAGRLPIHNNWVEDQVRPMALGQSNWLFAGSLRAGQRAAAFMSLPHSARINGHDPYAYIPEVLERLPLQPASRIGGLLPRRWVAASAHI